MKITHKIKLTENEMTTVRRALEKMLTSIDSDMRPWTELDEEPPEYMQEQFAEVSQLYNRLGGDPF